MELSKDIEDLLETIEPTIDKELKFVKDNDWTAPKSRSKRVSNENLHNMITDRATRHAEDIYSRAEGFIKHKRVSSFLKKVVQMYTIYEERYHKYTEKEDWTTYTEKGKSTKDAEEEIEFQSDILKNLRSMKSRLRKINFGEEDNGTKISFFDDKKASFAMKNVVLDRYPEIEDIIKERFENEAKIIPKKSSRKKS